MTYHIGHTYDDATLRVVLWGAVDGGSVDRLRDDIVTLGKERPVKRLLIDVRGLVDRVHPFEVVELVKRYPAEGRLQRVAVVEDAEQAKAHQFHETVARNRGYDLRHFTDPAQAERWLKP